MICLRLTLGRSVVEACGLGFIKKLANSNMPRTMKAEARTPHWKPVELLNRRLSMIGKMIPPMEEPEWFMKAYTLK